MKFIETSAKTAQNVDEAFTTMTKEIVALSSEKEKNITRGQENKPKIDLSKKPKVIDSQNK